MTFWQAVGISVVYCIYYFIECMFVGTAVDSFKKGRYYAFGFNLAAAIGFMTYIIKTILT